MKFKARFLAASAASFAKPFLIGTTAIGIGLTGSGALASSFLRYLVFPHIVPAVCFLFLAWDEKKYAPFKPLAGLVVGGSLAALLASLISAAVHPEKTFFVSGDARRLSVSVVASFIVVLIDLFSLIVLAPKVKRIRGYGAGAPVDDSDKTSDLPHKEQ
ncbi:MAG: hypothetical protein NT061_01175 [Spirochaetes bacterium]|nr:hypothetical protein [Spirochaetota bacterium]